MGSNNLGNMTCISLAQEIMTICPKCKKDCKTNHILKIHYSNQHGFPSPELALKMGYVQHTSKKII